MIKHPKIGKGIGWTSGALGVAGDVSISCGCVCHRFARPRLRHAKTRSWRPASRQPFLAFLSGEGGIRTPGTACAAQRFSRPPH